MMSITNDRKSKPTHENVLSNPRQHPIVPFPPRILTSMVDQAMSDDSRCRNVTTPEPNLSGPDRLNTTDSGNCPSRPRLNVGITSSPSKKGFRPEIHGYASRKTGQRPS